MKTRWQIKLSQVNCLWRAVERKMKLLVDGDKEVGMLTGGVPGTMRTADKLDSVESIDAARLKHWETFENHSTVDTRCSRRIIPRAIGCAQLLIVGVIEHTVVWHEQCIALERTDCKRCNRTMSKSRDSTGTGTAIIPAGTTSLRSGLGTFFCSGTGPCETFLLDI